MKLGLVLVLFLPVTVFANTAVPLLASSCAACHGTQGHSQSQFMPGLAGLEIDYIVRQMRAFKQGDINVTVMHQHASGLSDVEIRLLADYFSRQ
ncbi:cytochrome c553 [Methylophaga frappieri]|uniref:Cytochrome c553 n=1 Tax=Methylophaga frappieri (strain ATCC BAA-2434 / DSM 25690 / JAM7) TaxID=754477 RepID=I1YHF3_METFJ|nr:c-type cytochrome [Methylophaga frappieri]AFJ02346.1 cytochrome c553 [Methylophaga frappieri]